MNLNKTYVELLIDLRNEVQRDIDYEINENLVNLLTDLKLEIQRDIDKEILIEYISLQYKK